MGSGARYNTAGDMEKFIKQKLEKSLSSNDEDNKYGIAAIFKLFIVRVPSLSGKTEYKGPFVSEIKKYSLSSLESMRDAAQACLDILIEQGVGNGETWGEGDVDLYTDLYLPYRSKHKTAI